METCLGMYFFIMLLVFMFGPLLGIPKLLIYMIFWPIFAFILGVKILKWVIITLIEEIINLINT